MNGPVCTCGLTVPVCFDSSSKYLLSKYRETFIVNEVGKALADISGLLIKPVSEICNNGR